MAVTNVAAIQMEKKERIVCRLVAVAELNQLCFFGSLCQEIYGPKMPSQEPVTSKVVVHPLVLLSVVDHFNRMGKIGNQKRVVGVLLGCWRAKGVLDVSNSFAG